MMYRNPLPMLQSEDDCWRPFAVYRDSMVHRRVPPNNGFQNDAPEAARV